LLNGHKSTLQALQNLFQSVQLNINNPNFLIMQGKITKVLNMKPQEILGMVEEASGTRMFEDRKEKAWKTMARKEKKVEELASVSWVADRYGDVTKIQKLLREEIEPKLDKLREEKRSYLAYQKATSELERLTRLVKAYEWTLAVKRAAAAASEIEERHAQIKAAQADARAYVDEQGRMEKEIGEIQRRRDKVGTVQ
jgi:structural maintenance of chromosome 2